MLVADPFYFGTIRKCVIILGTLLNDIRIERFDSAGVRTDLIKVPLSYAPKEKMLTRLEGDPGDERRQFGVLLPRISFELVGMSYDQSRKIGSTTRRFRQDVDKNALQFQFAPVPYNLNFRAYVYAKNTEDGTKIIEQILPFFTPEWTVSAEMVPEMGLVVDVPTVLNSVSLEDAYTADFAERRALIWSLDLTMKAALYGPVRRSGVIKFAKTSIYMPSDPDLSTAVGVTDPSVIITVRPGMLANGSPTSNASLSVPYADIDVDDDYAIITAIQDVIIE
jgi:T4-like virus Myoviridae tail sheath stabiliser